MPNQDGTGPFGDGRPGRGLGPCGRFGAPLRGGTGRLLGRGFRWGWGCGRGPGRGYGFRRRGNGWDPSLYDRSAQERDLTSSSREDLEAQREELQKQLAWLNAQLQKDKAR